MTAASIRLDRGRLLPQPFNRREQEPQTCQHLPKSRNDQRPLQTDALTEYTAEKRTERGYAIDEEVYASIHPPQESLGCDGLAQTDLVDAKDWSCQPEEELGSA